MADVQVAVGLGGEAGLDPSVVFLRLQVLDDLVADEVRGVGLGRRVRAASVYAHTLCILYGKSGFAGAGGFIGCRTAPRPSNLRDNLRRDGKMRSMRSSASSSQFRQEALPMVRAA